MGGGRFLNVGRTVLTLYEYSSKSQAFSIAVRQNTAVPVPFIVASDLMP